MEEFSKKILEAHLVESLGEYKWKKTVEISERSAAGISGRFCKGLYVVISEGGRRL